MRENRITKADIRKYRRILKEATRRPSVIRTRDYLEASIVKPDFYVLDIGMGPNCNLRCPICLADCGPDKEGLPSPEIVGKTLSQAKDQGIEFVELTNGEPIRDENREVLGVAAEYSSELPLSILTNGTFASTPESAKEWFSFLKKKGLDPAAGENHLVVSYGKSYHVPPENYFNINYGFREVFPNIPPGLFLKYRLINFGDGEDNLRRHNQIIRGIYEVFGTRRSVHATIDSDEFSVRVYPREGPPIKFRQQGFVPTGRGKKMKVADHLYPLRELTPQDLTLEQRAADSVALSHTGDLNFGSVSSISDVRGQYGNISSTPLREILENMRRDRLFQVYKIGGSGFLYAVAQKADPNFKVKGKTRDDVLRRIFKSRRLQQGIREVVEDPKNLFDSYFEHVNSLDLRKRHKV